MKTLSTHIKKKACRMLLLCAAMIFMCHSTHTTVFAENRNTYSGYQISLDHQVPILISSPKGKKPLEDDHPLNTQPPYMEYKKEEINRVSVHSEETIVEKNVMTQDGVTVMQFFLLMLGLTTIWLFSIALGEAIEESLGWNNKINFLS